MSDTVVIAGAGPTGLMLACELSLAGVHAVVLEAGTEPRQDAPGIAINAGVIELLDQRGLMDPLRDGALTLPTVHFAMLPLAPDRLARHEDTVLVLQSRLERSLEERAVALGAEIRRGHEVTGLEEHADAVTVTARTADGDRRVEGRYLVGCDGRDSAVRGLAGIAFPGVEPDFHGLVGDVRIGFPDLVPELIGAHISAETGGHYAGAPLAPGLLRVITAEFGTAPPEGAVTLDELRAAVHRLTGADLRADDVAWLRRYGDPTRNAETYQRGRVLLAGEAAHVHFPLNGQGIEAGVHDAVSLGWRIAAEIAGWAPDGLVAGYHPERHPVGAWTCTNVRAQVELCHPPQKVDPIRELITRLASFEAVNEYLVELVTGVGVRYPMGPAEGERQHPLVGRRLPHVPLAAEDGETSVPRLLHRGRGLLLDTSDGRATAAVTAAGGWRDRIDVVRAAPSAAIGAALALVRPDGHVAWADRDSADTEGLVAALKTWFGEETS